MIFKTLYTLGLEDFNLLMVLKCPMFSSQLFLFATSNGSEKVIPIFEEAAKFFKGQVTLEILLKEFVLPVTGVFHLECAQHTDLPFQGKSYFRIIFRESVLPVTGVYCSECWSTD